MFQNKDFIANEQENYGFFWNGKNKLFQIINSNSLLTLKPNYDKSVDFKNSKNIIIEGDNLEVLKLLKSSYFEKVDVIYIDPPYNTGNDFVYNDKYKMTKIEYDESIENSNIKNSDSDGRYHTNWLNMIYPRLKLARSLLKDDGVIFISIDDNEQARLKIICDEIFGEHNFVSCMIWDKRNAQNDNKYVEKNHEYILFYAKNKTSFTINKKYVENSEGKTYELVVGSSEGGMLINRKKLGWTLYWNPETNEKIPKMDYCPDDVKHNSTIESLYNDDHELITRKFIPIRPKVDKNNNLMCWTWNIDRAIENIDKIIVRKKNDGSYSLYKKDDRKFKPLPNKSIYTEKSETTLFTLNDINSHNGSIELNKLNLKFSNPKSSGLLKHLIDKCSNKNALVLDFFAGSGTTGQAVMELNKEDDGDRNFILVQIPEKVESEKFQYITDITRERIIRSINKFGYKEKGFKYFQLTSSNFVEIDNEIQPSFFDSKFKKGTKDIDLLYEIILKIRLDLNTEFEEINIDGCKYFIDSSRTYIFSISENNNTDLLVKHLEIIKKDNLELTCDLYIKEELFRDDTQKINIFNEIKSKLENISVKVL